MNLEQEIKQAFSMDESELFKLAYQLVSLQIVVKELMKRAAVSQLVNAAEPITEPSSKYRRLTPDERNAIKQMIKEGRTIASINEETGVSRSTLSGIKKRMKQKGELS